MNLWNVQTKKPIGVFCSLIFLLLREFSAELFAHLGGGGKSRSPNIGGAAPGETIKSAADLQTSAA